MSEPPAPLTPPESDLQDFAFMPLHVARLRDSDLAAEESPTAAWFAVLLWCASWHQIPAGSLPDNETVLCKLVGLGRDFRTFRKHRPGAMRGFVLCSDGRLYHPVVAEQVKEAWNSKLQQRWRTECARIKKANQRTGATTAFPEFAEFVLGYVPTLSLGTPAVVPGDNASKGQGQGYIKKEEDSGARAPAAEAAEADPPNPEKVMFDAGVNLLMKAGFSERRARPLLGKWKSKHGAEAVIVALGKAQREGAVEPVSFIEGCLRNGGSHGPGSGSSIRRDRAGEMDAAMRDLGFS